MRARSFLALCSFVGAAAVGAAACSGGDGGGGPQPSPTIPYPNLSDYGLFEGNGASQTPVAGVIPYDVIATLFADHSWKKRFLMVAPGGRIQYEPSEPWDFPVGSIVIKTFYYPEDVRDPAAGETLLETRLLIRESDGWKPHTYVWNEAQTEATLKIAGARIPVAWIDTSGTMQSLEYRVPNTNQCLGCHGEPGVTHLLGPRTRQLNRDYDHGAGPVNQIDHLAALGLLDTTPPPIGDRETLVDPLGSAALDARARAYLDVNCAHCHNPDQSLATSSGLHLGFETTDSSALGVCRHPVAAGGGTGGLAYDIVPGDPDASIMVYRMASTDPEIKMPEMPTQLSDAAGVDLISQWITAMTPPGCQP